MLASTSVNSNIDMCRSSHRRCSIKKVFLNKNFLRLTGKYLSWSLFFNNCWTASERLNDVMLKMFLSYAKSLHCYFKMEHQTFLTNHFILFTHQKRAEPRLNQCESHFQNMRPSATIIRHRLRFALHREPTCLQRQDSREGSQSNQKFIYLFYFIYLFIISH